jgi:hypothetical protein
MRVVARITSQALAQCVIYAKRHLCSLLSYLYVLPPFLRFPLAHMIANHVETYTVTPEQKIA